MATPAPSAGIDLQPIFSPVYWGFVISLFLGGITVVQAFLYFFPDKSNRAPDAPLVQIVAGSMLLLDLASCALTAQSIHYYLLPHFGSLAPLVAVTPTLSAECLMSLTMTLISQMYFVRQLYVVYHLGKIHGLVVLLIAVLSILGYVAGIGCVVTMYKYTTGILSNRNKTFAVFGGLAKGISAVADIIATIAMTMTLQASISDDHLDSPGISSHVRRTNAVVRKLMQFVIQRGVLVTLIQVLMLIFFFAMPQNLIWFAFHINVSKLYANTFFAMLNGRQSFRKDPKGSTLNASTYGPGGTTGSSFMIKKGTNINHAEAGVYSVSESKSSPSFELQDKPDMPRYTRTVTVADK